jgi:hypothetical protein
VIFISGLRSASGLRQNRLRQNRPRQKRLRPLSRETIKCAPRSGCRMAAASFPSLKSLTQAMPTKEVCHVKQDSNRTCRGVIRGWCLPRSPRPWPTTLPALRTLRLRDVLARSSKIRRGPAIGARNTRHATRPVITASRPAYADKLKRRLAGDRTLLSTSITQHLSSHAYLEESRLGSNCLKGARRCGDSKMCRG